VVDSYLVVFAPDSGQDAMDVEATFTFDGPVLGVLDQSGIGRTNRLFGLPDVTPARGGIEFGDYIQISEDRRTVHIRLSAVGTGSDQVRLLVESPSGGVHQSPQVGAQKELF
jgi:hypothetical protein